MKRIGIFLFTIIFLINFMSDQVIAVTSQTVTNIDLVGQGAILIERETEEVLYEKNMDQKMYPASTTKIMTAIVALEYGDLEELVEVGTEVEGIPWYSNKANLQVGDKLSLHHLLYGLLLPSGNDAANTIAVHISKKISNNQDLTLAEAHEIFSDLMNQKTKEIGANNTNFVNPHGFHHDNQYTSPWDMAIIGKAAMENEIFREIVATQEAIYYNGEVWENTNHLILEDNENYYSYTRGIKTGSTAAAGKCLVSSATKGNTELIAVVLKSTDDDIWADTTSLFSYGFENYENHYLANEGEKILSVELLNGESDQVNSLDIIVASKLESFINKKDIGEITEEITWNNNYLQEVTEGNGLRLLSTINKGDQVGNIRYLLNETIIGESILVAGDHIPMELEEIDSIPDTMIYGIITIVIIIVASILVVVKNLKAKKESKYNN